MITMIYAPCAFLSRSLMRYIHVCILITATEHLVGHLSTWLFRPEAQWCCNQLAVCKYSGPCSCPSSSYIHHVEKVLQLHKHSRALKLVVTICLVATCMLSCFLFLTRYAVALCSVPAACCSYVNALDCVASQNMKDSSDNLIWPLST